MSAAKHPPPPSRRHPVQYAVKRSLEFLLAAAGLILLSPLAIVIALAIRLDSRGPVIFRQERLGRGMKPFQMYKFRTMADGSPIEYNADGTTKAERGDARITKVGRLLRGGLDELPQLANVLRGEMSLIGPRPDLPGQEREYTEVEKRKTSVRPGISNLPAVLGRNQIPWKTRIAIDLYYLDNWSLLLDLKIAIATAMLMVGRRPFKFRELANHVSYDHGRGG